MEHIIRPSAWTITMSIMVSQSFSSKKDHRNPNQNYGGLVVEAGGVEPPSENTSSGTSPGADGYFHSLTMT